MPHPNTASAVIYSLMLTCRACGVAPLTWLRHVQTGLPQRDEAADIVDLLLFMAYAMMGGIIVGTVVTLLCQFSTWPGSAYRVKTRRRRRRSLGPLEPKTFRISLFSKACCR